MQTFFYERTAYQLSAEPVPDCFVKLDQHFDLRFSAERDALVHPHVIWAESICARMADVEMYAFLVADVRNRSGIGRDEPDANRARFGKVQDERLGDGRAAILTRSFVIGYIAACKSLLNACAAALTDLYDLAVPLSSRSFSDANFWHQLVLSAPNIHRRYHAMRLFFNEVASWGDNVAHHLPPVGLLLGRDYLGQPLSPTMRTQAVETRNVTLGEMVDSNVALRWIDPIDLHRRWKPQLLTVCEKICQEIERET